MLIADICIRKVVCARHATTAAGAARLMRERHVGDVVVVDRDDEARMPIGIVTDRDIVIKVVAAGIDPASVTLGELISWGDLATVQESASDADAIRSMHDKGVRRMPVVDRGGILVGIVSLDDILPRYLGEFSKLAEVAALAATREDAAYTPHARPA
ncbi:MAG TPA: CBS domain-containing protein [Casimicrobiaceae bacterium]|nr:CBS domain-containing protein [Casimicrobiaceae bacterium]